MTAADYTKHMVIQAKQEVEDVRSLLKQSSSELAELGVMLNNIMSEIGNRQQTILRTIQQARNAQATADSAIAGTASLRVANAIRALAKIDQEQTNDVLRLAELKRRIESLIRDILNSMQTSNRETQAQAREAISELETYINIL
jgi:Lon protease-like protein